jgi:hypothetical protein
MSATLSFSLIAGFFPLPQKADFSLLLEEAARHTGQPRFVDAPRPGKIKIT